MNHAIEVTSLEKRYGAHKVLKGLTFSVRQGEIFALLGANGAGKTTTLECLEGLRPYDSGCIVVSGKRGIQLQSASLPGYLQCREAVQLFAKWNHVPVDTAMLAALGIPDLAKNGTTPSLPDRNAGSIWPWPCWVTQIRFSWTSPPLA